MNHSFSPFILDSCVQLFRDPEAFREFVGKMEAACQNTATPILSGGKVIALTVSKEAGKDLLYERILTDWAKDPARLRRLSDSLQEDPVELGDL